MTPFLQIVEGAARGEVPLTEDRTILGRGPRCHVVIPVKAVTREHASIFRVGGQFFIEDNQSRNGTFVNEERVTGRRLLQNNDAIRICDFQATFHDARELKEWRVNVRVSAAQPLVVAGGVNVPDYLSPAQIDESGAPAKSASDDLHAVGVMAYQMFTGDLPFPDHPLMAKLEAIAQRRFDSAAERCRQRGFDTRLGGIIDAALAGRYRHGGAMLDDLAPEWRADDLPGTAPPREEAAGPRPGEGFAVRRMLFEDSITEAYEAHGLASGALVTLRLFKPAFQGDRYVALARELAPARLAPESSFLPGILRRHLAGRARPTPVRAGQELQIDPDLQSDGCLALVEEYAGNRTLMDVLRGGELVGNEPRVRAILTQLLTVLSAGHAAECVHGNLTPYCVFLGPDDAVKIEGFGLHTEMERLRMESGGDTQNVSTALRLGKHPTEMLRELFEISSNLARTLELDRLLPKVVDSLFQVFKQADRCFIILVEEGTGRLLPRVITTRRPQDEANARFSSDLARKCLETNQLFLSHSASSDKRIRSVMGAPLLAGAGPAFGVIQLDTQDRGKKFGDDDLKLLSEIVTQVDIALENARLYRDVEVRAEKRDLELATAMRTICLPAGHPHVAGYELHAHYSPAGKVGGDYYGFVPLGPGRLAFSVGEVAGSGAITALLMAKLSSDLRCCLLSETELTRAISKLNDLVYQGAGRMDRFITLAGAVLDSTSHVVSIVNAGHVMPMLYRAASGAFEDAMPKEAVGLPLGIMDGQTYEAHRVPLGPGDCLLLFSDGVTDALNVRGELFTLKGVSAALKGEAGLSPHALGELIVKAVQRHAAGRAPGDDLTLLCVGRVGEGGTGRDEP